MINDVPIGHGYPAVFHGVVFLSPVHRRFPHVLSLLAGPHTHAQLARRLDACTGRPTFVRRLLPVLAQWYKSLYTFAMCTALAARF